MLIDPTFWKDQLRLRNKCDYLAQDDDLWVSRNLPSSPCATVLCDVSEPSVFYEMERRTEEARRPEAIVGRVPL
jgi:hypothetical protein